MESPSSAAQPELVFSVEFQEVGGEYNADLRGQGRLTIGSTEPFYRFTGETRAMFRRPTALPFHAHEIWNVSVLGRRVEFSTRVGTAGKTGRPFVFYCASPTEAAQVARLLPRTRDAEFVSTHDFSLSLRSLPRPSSSWAWSTNLIIAANVVAFVIMGCFGAGWFSPEEMRPYLLFAANNGGATTDGEWWRIVTAMFVHYGLLHLLLNMWALFQTGHFVEHLFGRRLYTLGYLGSGIIASFTSILWHGDKIWSAGASGAVFGVYGLLLGFMLREKQSIPKAILRPLLTSTIPFVAYSFFFGLVHPQIDNAAHAGGLLGGLSLGWLMALPVDRETRELRSGGRFALGLAVLTVAVAIGVILAPRYDYRFREELRWSEAVESRIEKEPALLKEQHTRLSAFQQTNRGAELAGWLEQTAIPFYEQWLGELQALTLTPGKVTERRRRVLVPLLEAKLANYRQLASSARADDASAVPRYLEAEQRAAAATDSAEQSDRHVPSD